MRAEIPGAWVDCELLPADGLSRSHPPGPNHVTGHGIKTHGVKDFSVVRNFDPVGHRSSVLKGLPCDRVCSRFCGGSTRDLYGELKTRIECCGRDTQISVQRISMCSCRNHGTIVAARRRVSRRCDIKGDLECVA